MDTLVQIINKYMLEIVVTGAVLAVLLFLIRSFKRSMLIENGQTRFVIEHYDVSSARLYKSLVRFVFFVVIPLLAYVKYRSGIY